MQALRLILALTLISFLPLSANPLERAKKDAETIKNRLVAAKVGGAGLKSVVVSPDGKTALINFLAGANLTKTARQKMAYRDALTLAKETFGALGSIETVEVTALLQPKQGLPLHWIKTQIPRADFKKLNWQRIKRDYAAIEAFLRAKGKLQVMGG